MLMADIRRAKKTYLFYAEVWGKLVVPEGGDVAHAGRNAFCQKKVDMYTRLARDCNVTI